MRTITSSVHSIIIIIIIIIISFSIVTKVILVAKKKATEFEKSTLKQQIFRFVENRIPLIHVSVMVLVYCAFLLYQY